MRAIITAILIIAVGFGLFWALKPQAPTDIPSAGIGATSTPAATTTAPAATTTAASGKQVALTSFTFTGYGPGKEHVGTFKDWSVSNVAVDANGVPTAGRFTIKTASVSTGIDGLDKHLCSPDFFDCAANPEIVFDLKSIKARALTPTEIGSSEIPYDVSGDLTFNSVTKSFSFPVSAKADGTFVSDFKFDTTFFNFKYAGIDKEVRVQFAGQAK